MTNHCHALTDKQWTLVQLALPTGRRGLQSRLGDRNFIDAVLYRAKTGIAWRDLPERFGAWKTIYNKFARWSHFGHWARIFKVLQIRVDEDGVIIDSSSVRAPQVAAGRKGGSKAMHWVVLEVDSPVHALVDAQGRSLHIELTPGPQHESTVAESILRAHARGQKVVADTGYDSDAI